MLHRPIELAQYTSAQFARTAAQAGVRLSVGRTGQCWDNAVAESFFATIKTELLHQRPWSTKTQAHQAIFSYIEGWYNTRRHHSSLGYLSPATYETTTQPATTPATARPHSPTPSAQTGQAQYLNPEIAHSCPA